MAAWDGHETDAIRLFAQDRSTQRVADADAERLASQIRTELDQAGQPKPAHQHHGWQHVHIHVPHFSH